MSSGELVGFINNLFVDSKFFLIESKKQIHNMELSSRYTKASMLFAWAAFEGWINKTSLDFSITMKRLTVHERAFLTEKRIELKNGVFQLTNSIKYESNQEKLEFLLSSIAKTKLNKSTKHWQDFQEIKKLRDSLVHPKLGSETSFNIEKAEKTIEVLVYYLNLLSKKLYNKNFKI